jgi:hypothetical protein
MKQKFQLNTELFLTLLNEKGWGITEAAEIINITRNQIWKMMLPVSNPHFSSAGIKSRKALKNLFPESDNLFLPLDLHLRK